MYFVMLFKEMSAPNSRGRCPAETTNAIELRNRQNHQHAHKYLENWRHERVVHNQQQASSLGDLRNLGNVHNLQRGIRWRLNPHHLGLGRDCFLQFTINSQVDEREVNAIRLQGG
jgi:hypothetical protein